MTEKTNRTRTVNYLPILLGFLFFITGCNNEVEEIPGFSNNYQKWVKTLASDSFEGRAPSTPGGNKTEAFIEAEFRRMGLKPANDGSYRQTVPLVEITSYDHTPMMVNTENDSLSYEYLTEMVIGSAHRVDSINVSNSEMVFAGYGIVAPEYDWNDYEGLDVKGKTVVVLVNDPGFELRDEDLFTGYRMTYYGRWTYKFEEAARQGAEGILVIHETEPASYGWSVVRNGWSGPQYYIGDTPDVMPAPVEGWISLDTAEELFGKMGMTYDEAKQMALKRDFQAFSLNAFMNAQFKVDYKFTESDNIIGYVEGREYPDETLIYMAHWDHLGKVETDEGTQIYNGAIDNATGTAALMAIAEKFSQLNPAPKRSVVFLAVTAEESGLIGSGYYAMNPLFDLAKTAGGINMDGLNIHGPTNDVEVIGFGTSDIQDFLEKGAADQNRVLVPNPEPEKGFFYRSDHFQLVKQGVPMIYANSGTDFIGRNEDFGKEMREKNQNTYHTPNDIVTDEWNWDGLNQNLWLYYNVGLDIANSEIFPQWAENSEFRALRQESSDQRIR